MNAFKSLVFAGVLLPLAACGKNSDAQQALKDANRQIAPDKISAAVAEGIDKAKQELQTQNIDVNNVGVHVHNGKSGTSITSDTDANDTRPKAEITPQGDFLVDGKTVSLTPAQRTLALDYRGQIIGIAEAGMDIGKTGAALGISAAKEALWGAITGKSDKDIEAAIKPQTDRIEAAAKQLCTRLPTLQASQQKLAAALPEFKPYATMTQKDIEDCGKDDGKNAMTDEQRAKLQADIRDRIRNGVRKGAQTAAGN